MAISSQLGSYAQSRFLLLLSVSYVAVYCSILGAQRAIGKDLRLLTRCARFNTLRPTWGS
jgi:hypothetical protein